MFQFEMAYMSVFATSSIAAAYFRASLSHNISREHQHRSVFVHPALPRHIFESRYRQMIRHALDGSITSGFRSIAIASTGLSAKMAERNQLLRSDVCVAHVVQFLMAVLMLWFSDFATNRSIELMSQRVRVCIVRQSCDQSKIQLWLFLDWRKCEVKCVRYFRDWEFLVRQTIGINLDVHLRVLRAVVILL